MSDAAWIFLTVAIAPMIIVGVVAMVRGYHVLVRLYRPDADDPHEGGDR